MNRVIGRTEVPLMRYDVIHTSLDALLADALREATGTDIALSNGFRFAPPKAPGDITEADLWNWLPINTPVKVGNVTGSQLREFWEKELENVFSKDPKKLFGGWLPRPSGMTMRFAADALSGKRIRDLRIGGVPVEDNKSYTIASCEREGDADDTLCRIPHVANPRTLEFDAHAAVKKFLAKHSPIRSTEAPRVVCEDRPPVLRSQFLSATEASPPQPGPKAVKAVVHINFADTTRQGQGLKNVQNILKEVKGSAAIEVVVHAAGIPLLVKDNSAHAEQIQDLIKQGVRFVACENTMREKSISKEDLLPGVDTVPSGAVEVLRKQQDGYGYFRP
jgi:intracellular sulfur oxidation DsrE/DsrF family protein